MKAKYIKKGIIEIVWEDFMDDIPPFRNLMRVSILKAEKLAKELEEAAAEIRAAIEEEV